MATRDELIRRSIEQGLRAGCPPEQVEHFISWGYFPTLKQWEFHAASRRADNQDEARYIGLGGARGGAKSHGTLGQVGLDDCQRVPGSKHLFLRKLAKAADESFEDLIGQVFVGIPHQYIPSKGRLRFPNGSRIILGGFKNPGDIDNYLGIQYDTITIEEATQLTEVKFDLIDGSLRTSRNGWRPRLYMTTNPGGVGHAWFKRRFIMPYRANTQRESFFIQSTYKDNPFLDPDYRKYLERLTGDLGKAWRDGDWDVFEGQAFPQFSPEEHVIEAFDIPEWWPKWRAIDWGHAAPFCCLWFTKNPDTSTIYVYRELYKSGLTDLQQARLILELTPPDEHIALTYADPSMWSTKTMEDKVTTTSTTYAEAGVPLTRGNNDRLQGKRMVDQLLAIQDNGQPGLQLFRQVKHLANQLQELIYDESRTEDVDTDLEDHAFDALKYGLTNVKLKGKDPSKKRTNQSPLVRAFGSSRRR